MGPRSAVVDVAMDVCRRTFNRVRLGPGAAAGGLRIPIGWGTPRLARPGRRLCRQVSIGVGSPATGKLDGQRTDGGRAVCKWCQSPRVRDRHTKWGGARNTSPATLRGMEERERAHYNAMIRSLEVVDDWA